MQAPLQNRFKDLPEADMKEILHQRMWETDSYKSHKDHLQLYEALEKSMNRDHSEELVKDLAEARKKKKKSRESPKTPPRSPPHQPPPPPPPADLQMDEDMALDEQAQSSDDEDIGRESMCFSDFPDCLRPFKTLCFFNYALILCQDYDVTSSLRRGALQSFSPSVRETMEIAFWDGITASIQQHNYDRDRVILSRKQEMFRRGIGMKNNSFDEAEKRMRKRISNGFDAPLKLPF
nr:hypothetical protein [Tanacetum cinerariifolium]